MSWRSPSAGRRGRGGAARSRVPRSLTRIPTRHGGCQGAPVAGREDSRLGQLGLALEQHGQLGNGSGRLVEFGNDPVEVLVCQHHVFFFNDTATTEIYTLSLHDALPIFRVIALVIGEALDVAAVGVRG